MEINISKNPGSKEPPSNDPFKTGAGLFKMIGLKPLLLVIGLVALATVAAAIIFPRLTGTYVANTEVPPGDLNAYDPIASLADVAVFAGEDAKLLRMNIKHVRRDGTMDLEADYSPIADYDFVVPTERPESAPPSGADSQWWIPVGVKVGNPGKTARTFSVDGGGVQDYQYVNKGMVREALPAKTARYNEFVPMPYCTLKEMWDVAVEKGAAEEAVATIVYDKDDISFRIQEAGFWIKFNTDCTFDRDLSQNQES